MNIIYDVSNHDMYPIGQDGFTSGTVIMVRKIAEGLANRDHVVHVITPDLEVEEQRGPTLWYWPKDYHPRLADVAIQLMHVNPQPSYDAVLLILQTFGIDPYLGPDHSWASNVDAFSVLSEIHGSRLRQARPTIQKKQIFVTGLGVDLDDYRGGILPAKVPCRMLYANDPCRGLLDVLDIFDIVKKKIPEATLHVAYDFDANLDRLGWEHSQRAQMLWECKIRMEHTPGVVNLSKLSRQEIIQEQIECSIHIMPSNAHNDQWHGLTQLECAAAGAVLVLSDIGAFPELFDTGATVLPQIGKYYEELNRRINATDYAGQVIKLMQNHKKWEEKSQKARAMAAKFTWDKVIDAWEQMFAKLVEDKDGRAA